MKTRIKRKIHKIIIVFFLAIFAFLVWGQLDKFINNSLTTDGKFTQIYSHKKIYDLYDIGVVDINNDDILDIFTTNHNARQLLLLGDGRGKLTNNLLSQWRLDQNPNFPGMEDSNVEPLINVPGLYIYWHKSNLVIQSKDIASVGGEINLSSGITVKQKHLFSTEINENRLSSGASQTSIKFTASKTGRLVLKPDLVALPISFKVDSKLPLKSLYIGNQRINALSHNFVLYLKDRHGMAWANYSGDNQIDVFISRGGLRGKMNQLPEIFRDELLINNGSSFNDHTLQSNIDKDGCSARQVASVDFDSDDLLDIYVVCGRKHPPTQFQPNQLYHHEINHTFVNVAEPRGLDIPEVGSFVWLDIDNDGDLDLFWKDKKEFRLYINQSGQFNSQSIGLNPGNQIGKLTIADYDADGDLDLFAASANRNTLLVNTDGKYQSTDPTTVGLPIKSLTANWVDYDNDGLTDLHTVPEGLYRQNRDHKFKATHLLESKSPKLVAEARSTWFDADNDGLRDLLMATRYRTPRWARIFNGNIDPKEWTLKLYRNVSTANHWLEIKLVGATSNRQAIGARVAVTTSNGFQFQQVGQAEGSVYSQGHYRLYFGLGKDKKVASVKIFWSNGQLQEIKNPAIDQLLVIKQEN